MCYMIPSPPKGRCPTCGRCRDCDTPPTTQPNPWLNPPPWVRPKDWGDTSGGTYKSYNAPGQFITGAPTYV